MIWLPGTFLPNNHQNMMRDNEIKQFLRGTDYALPPNMSILHIISSQLNL